MKYTVKDSDGDIAGLGNKDGEFWEQVAKALAISHIERGGHTYYVEDSSGRSNVQLVSGQNGKYLCTDPNGGCSESLGCLPDCEPVAAGSA